MATRSFECFTLAGQPRHDGRALRGSPDIASVTRTKP
jgi:hypothetical protein